MAITRFTRQTMPQSGEELKRELQKALDSTLPLDDFVQVIKDLTELEHRHKMKSEEFFAQFQRGELGDSLDFIRWATKYEIYQEMKTELEVSRCKPTK